MGGVEKYLSKFSPFSFSTLDVEIPDNDREALPDNDREIRVETVQNKVVPVFRGFSLLLRIYLIFSR